MRFIANENFPLASVRHLRQVGHEVAAICEDSPGIQDHEVLARALGEQRIVLTFDKDYGELIFRHGLSAPSGIVYFRLDPLTPEEPAERLLRLLTAGVSLEGKFTVVERVQVRQRRLP